jgi:hypothetical protein
MATDVTGHAHCDCLKKAVHFRSFALHNDFDLAIAQVANEPSHRILRRDAVGRHPEADALDFAPIVDTLADHGNWLTSNTG